MRKKKIFRILAALVFLLGLGVLLFPRASQAVYQHQVNQRISDYEQAAQAMKEDQPVSFDQLFEAIRAYNEQLYETGQQDLTDPFSYEQPGLDLKQYGFAEEMFGYLQIEKLRISLPIFLGASQTNLERGAALLTQTSIPIGGNNTNAVLAAHRGMSTAEMFRHIDRLEPGDLVTITNMKETLTYRVAEIEVIEPYEIDKIFIQPGKELITLLTCHPYPKNTQRIVVYCKRV